MTILTILFALILRLIAIDQPFWLDESIGVYHGSNMSFGELFMEFPKFDFHPPLFYLILKLWGSIVGYSEVAIRFLPVIFGVLTVYVIYKIAKELKVNAIAASLLLATSPLHIYYSQEVRMYPLVAFVVSLAFLFFIRLQTSDRLVNWVGFSLSVFVFMALDYMPIFVLPVFFVSALFLKKKRDFLLKLFFSLSPLFLAGIVWSPILKIQIEGARNLSTALPLWTMIIGSPTPKEFGLVWVKFIIGRISFMNKFIYTAFVAAVSIPFVLTIAAAVKKKNSIILMWFAIPLALGFAASFIVPAFTYFRFLYLLPAFYLILASQVKKVALIAFVAINLFCSIYYFSNTRFWREDWKSAASIVDTQSQDGEVALFAFSEPVTPYKWYSANKIPAYGIKEAESLGISNSASGVWYFEYLADITDPSRDAMNKLKENFTIEKEFSFRGVGKVTYFKKQE